MADVHERFYVGRRGSQGWGRLEIHCPLGNVVAMLGGSRPPPEGFAAMDWGTMNEHVVATAHHILYETYRPGPIAETFAEELARDVLARMDRMAFDLSAEEVRRWVQAHDKAALDLLVWQDEQRQPWAGETVDLAATFPTPAA